MENDNNRIIKLPQNKTLQNKKIQNKIKTTTMLWCVEETKNKKPDDAIETKAQPAQDQETKEKIGKNVTNLLPRKVKKASNKKESISGSKKAQKPKKKRGGWWQQK